LLHLALSLLAAAVVHRGWIALAGG